MRQLWRNTTWFVTAPFRWIARIFDSLASFFSEEPEDTALADTFAKAVEDPSGLLFHLDALRKHLLRAVLYLIIAVAVSFFFSNQILDFLAEPIGGMNDLIAIDVTEPLTVFMKVTLLSGFAIALPLIVLEIYLFIAPGISSRARRWGILAIPAVLVLFIGGMAFAYFVMLPTALPFLLNIMGMTTQVRPSSYISFVTRILFWVGLAFEFPLVIFIMASLGWVNADTLRKNWRIALVVIAFVAALITPTIDPVNMGIVMAPMIVLYFLSIGLAAIAQRNRTRESVGQKPGENS